ncbi:MAG: type 4a pilus biogenesis protein PilO [Minisyncoccota bacterium]
MNSRILPALALIIAIGIFFAYVNPAWTGSIAAAKAAIANDDQALATAQQYTAQQNQLATARDAIDPANQKALDTFLPSSVDNVGLILDLNALASRSGLSIANVDVITNAATDANAKNAGALSANTLNPVASVDLSLSATGTFAALQTFLVGVEKSARLLDVHDLTVKGSDTGVYTYQMTISLYWLR